MGSSLCKIPIHPKIISKISNGLLKMFTNGRGTIRVYIWYYFLYERFIEFEAKNVFWQKVLKKGRVLFNRGLLLSKILYAFFWTYERCAILWAGAHFLGGHTVLTTLLNQTRKIDLLYQSNHTRKVTHHEKVQDWILIFQNRIKFFNFDPFLSVDGAGRKFCHLRQNR